MQNQDDHATVRELALKSDIVIAGMPGTSLKSAGTVYHVYVTTSNIPHAGTDANVYIQCVHDQ